MRGWRLLLNQDRCHNCHLFQANPTISGTSFGGKDCTETYAILAIIMNPFTLRMKVVLGNDCML